MSVGGLMRLTRRSSPGAGRGSRTSSVPSASTVAHGLALRESAAGVATVAMMVLLFWLLVQFTAALHGFENLAKVAFGVIVAFLASAMVAGMLLVSLGLVPVPAAG